jgi:hypothetical protein
MASRIVYLNTAALLDFRVNHQRQHSENRRLMMARFQIKLLVW